LILSIVLLDSIVANGLGAMMAQYLANLPNKPILLTGSTAVMLAIQLAMSPAIGSWSDKAGRRPAVIATTIASLITSLFLLPIVPWTYLINRSAKGATNGLYAVLRSSVADITEREALVTYSGMLQFLIGAGGIVGPAFTGILLLTDATARIDVKLTVWLLLAVGVINVGLALCFRETNDKEREPFGIKDLAHKALDALKVKTLWQQLNTSEEQVPGIKPLFILNMLATLSFGYYAFFIAFLTESQLSMSPRDTAYFFIYFGSLAMLSNGIFFRYIVNRVNKRRVFIIALLVGIGAQLGYAFAEKSLLLLYVTAGVDAISMSLLGGLIGGILSEVAKQGQNQGETFGGFQALGGLASFVAALANTLLSGVSMMAPFMFCILASLVTLWWLFRLPKEALRFIDRVGSAEETKQT
jgi:DHA1 family tetracycline resistance protein-like MFS transporter